jgi:hypothetical protein
METTEKRALLQKLTEGRDVFLKATDGMADELARRSPAPGKWSVLDCIEHVNLAEDYMFAQIAAAQRSDTPIVNPQRETAIQERGLDRTRRVPAPREARPTGRFLRLQDARQHFLNSRQQTIQFVEGSDADLRAMPARHPLIGQVNCYEMLLIIAVHPFRHAQQIEEIRNELRG